MIKPRLEIFNSNQAKVFPKLSFLTRDGFYLAGGTALSLQLGHRTSLDFDFYNPKHFDAKELYNKIEKQFGEDAQKTGEEKDTLFCRISKTECSFFWYQYPLIKKTVKVQGVTLASIEDIAAMKLIAVSHRPAKRDYLDIFFLLQKFTLDDMFSYVSKKYPNFNPYFALRALTYFEDIKEELEQRAIKIVSPNFSWEEAKEKIFAEVKKYQLSMIKKD